MNKKAIITVDSTVLNDEKDLIEVITPGDFCKIEDGFKVQYDETELSGMKGTKTTMIIRKDSFDLIREGTTETKMEFVVNEITTTMYKTPYGVMDIDIYTKKLDIDVNENGGTINAIYILEIGGQPELTTNLNVEIKTHEEK